MASKKTRKHLYADFQKWMATKTFPKESTLYLWDAYSAGYSQNSAYLKFNRMRRKKPA